MKILFITPSYKPAYCYGGPTVSVSELAESLVRVGHSVTVYTTTANGKSELDVPAGVPQHLEGVEVVYFKRVTKDHTHVSLALWKKLWKTCKGYDVIHVHSWWSLLVLGAALICKWRKKRFVLSPRGMLGSYSFHHQHSTVKRVLHSTLGKRLLQGSVLHATTALEWRDCMRVNSQWEGFTLHNLVNLPSFYPAGEFAKQPVFTMGFLSRIDPKKGIELLLEALAEVPFQFRLLIAGNGEREYIESLKSLAEKSGIGDRVEWCGWKDKTEKFDFMRELDLYVLTSYNENFAIAVTESLSVGTPVLVSEGVGLSDYVQERRLGFVCQISSDSIRENLINIYNNQGELLHIRREAPGIIQRDFHKEKLANQYIKAYAGLAGNNLSYSF